MVLILVFMVLAYLEGHMGYLLQKELGPFLFWSFPCRVFSTLSLGTTNSTILSDGLAAIDD